jgi:hypothetical protein
MAAPVRSAAPTDTSLHIPGRSGTVPNEFQSRRLRSVIQTPAEDTITDVFRKLLVKDRRGKEDDSTCCSPVCRSLRRRYKAWRAHTPDLNAVWRESFKSVDGRFGSAMALCFLYMRWIFFHNLGMFLLWGIAVIVRVQMLFLFKLKEGN